MKKKYNLAVVKRTVDFSKDTYSKEYNKFSHFIASNSTFAKMEANAAKNGYTVQERKDQFCNEHYVANIPGTKDALRWLFEAKEGDLSQLYECGNNDNMLIIYVTGKHKVGYRPATDPEVKKALTQLALRDKKAEKIMSQLKGKNLQQALELPAASRDTLNGITFAMPAFVASTGGNEPVLAGGVSYGKLNSHLRFTRCKRRCSHHDQERQGRQDPNQLQWFPADQEHCQAYGGDGHLRVRDEQLRVCCPSRFCQHRIVREILRCV